MEKTIGDEKQEQTYEAPRVETVITGEELEREIHYAGNNGTLYYDIK